MNLTTYEKEEEEDMGCSTISPKKKYLYDYSLYEYKGTEYIGVFYNKYFNVFKVRVHINKKSYTLGYYDDIIEAAKSRDRAYLGAASYKRKFRLNFPHEPYGVVKPFEEQLKEVKKTTPRKESRSKLNHKPPQRFSSRYKGVSFFVRRNEWRASYNSTTNRKYLGSYDTEEEAAMAYNNYVMNVLGYETPVNNIPVSVAIMYPDGPVTRWSKRRKRINQRNKDKEEKRKKKNREIEKEEEETIDFENDIGFLIGSPIIETQLMLEEF